MQELLPLIPQASEPPQAFGAKDTHQGKGALAAIATINQLARESKPDLTCFDNMIYQSAIDGAWETAKKDGEKLDGFIDVLSFLLNKNGITRGLRKEANARLQAIMFAAEKLADAYDIRRGSTRHKPNDHRLSQKYRSIAEELKDKSNFTFPQLCRLISRLIKQNGIEKLQQRAEGQRMLFRF